MEERKARPWFYIGILAIVAYIAFLSFTGIGNPVCQTECFWTQGDAINAFGILLTFVGAGVFLGMFY